MYLARWPDLGDSADPTQDINGPTFTIYGKCSPDVSGSYIKSGTNDGVSSFTRNGQVDGLQYYLHRNTWDYQGYTYTAWFITTQISGNPYWVCYQKTPGVFAPEGKVAGTGKPSAYNPARILNGFAYTTDPISGTTFTYTSDRPLRWQQASDAWVEGLWYWNWADHHLPIAKLDTINHAITVPNLPNRNGVEDPIVANRPWYAYNLLEEITQPGEWYLDRTTGILYLWPPDTFNPSSDVVVSMLSQTLLSADGVSYMVFQNFTLEASRRNLLDVTNGNHVTLSNLVLRNSGCTGGTVSGSNNLVTRCTLTGTGNSGLWFSGGDRLSLTHGNSTLENCEFHHYARTVCTNVFGVSLGGCGNIVRNNMFHHAPNAAFFFGGNDQLMELNEIHNVCQGAPMQAPSIAAFSTAGAPGEIIRYNSIHHVSPASVPTTFRASTWTR
ncbi:MAG: right-handed parallel beta-helix repeat-containing protein [Verrucomicrobia bacterium]|nr:right-handed parallel beta-helix repeat-containing protein [Verrucomicrobiota bacterium]